MSPNEENAMKQETRKMLADLLRARKAGQTGLLFGDDVTPILELAARCGLAGPKGRLP